jgi:hypothetical protein
VFYEGLSLVFERLGVLIANKDIEDRYFLFKGQLQLSVFLDQSNLAFLNHCIEDNGTDEDFKLSEIRL